MHIRHSLPILISLVAVSGCSPSANEASYEDCVLSGMKGRDMSQQYLVEESCREKFPLLKDFIKTSKIGVLTCTWEQGNKTPFEVHIEKDKVSFYLGDFTVLRRRDNGIDSKSDSFTLDGKWKDGAMLNMSFVYGVGYIFDVNNEKDQFVFSCQTDPLHQPSS